MVANGRVDAESRIDRFMKSALAIMAKTGRTDFTVVEVVERSKTSLRVFYQHFASKDELMLALIEQIMTESSARWHTETDGMSCADALRLLIDRLSTPAESSTQDSINRGLTSYNDHLAESRPREYARVLAPLHKLLTEILARGVAEGTLRADVDVDAAAAIIMQGVLGVARLQTLGAELTGTPVDGERLFDFCMRGLAAPSA